MLVVGSCWVGGWLSEVTCSVAAVVDLHTVVNYWTSATS